MFANRTKQSIKHEGKTHQPPTLQELSLFKLTDQVWRLNNLYHIVNKHGELVKFRLRPIQKHFLENMWYRNVILKSRQLGFTTFLDVWMLDKVLFVPNTRGVIIAHRIDDASAIMETKVELPYANLHPHLKETIALIESNKSEMKFSNGSSIKVTTSGRSGVAQILHISELGYTAHNRPDTAAEIMAGSIPAVHGNSFVHVESTAMGSSGEFYNLCMNALNKKRERRKLTHLDFKFHFYPWHEDHDNELTGEETTMVPIPDRLHTYFDELKVKHGVTLSDGQKAWYATQDEALQDKVKAEHPSFPEEAFENSGEGNYFSRQMALVREEGRICHVPHQVGRLVHVYFDVGVNDPTAVWFMQPAGPHWHALHYYENADNGMEYHVGQVRKIASDNGWAIGEWVGPHDMRQRSKGAGISLDDELAKLGVRFNVTPRVAQKITSIEVARRMLSVTRFDEKGCELGIKRLDNYRKKWDKIRGVWADNPLHDENSDGADAYQCFAMSVEGRDLEARLQSGVQKDPRKAGGALVTEAGAPIAGQPQTQRRARMRAYTV